jgi:hypothetical protein
MHSGKVEALTALLKIVDFFAENKGQPPALTHIGLVWPAVGKY